MYYMKLISVRPAQWAAMKWLYWRCSYELVCAGNRRLDEWVPLSRFESLEPYCVDTYHNGLHSAAGLDLMSSGDRKITRNQKRKHDAINHVQTVCAVQCLSSSLNLKCFLNTTNVLGGCYFMLCLTDVYCWCNTITNLSLEHCCLQGTFLYIHTVS